MQSGFVAVDASAGSSRFNGMLKMNETAAFIAEILRGGADIDEIVRKMLEKYDVSEADAKKSAEDVISVLRGEGLIEDE